MKGKAMTIPELIGVLDEVSAMKAELKRRCMIYQYGAKMAVAKHYGMTFDQVNLPFREWMDLRQRFRDETGFDPN